MNTRRANFALKTATAVLVLAAIAAAALGILLPVESAAPAPAAVARTAATTQSANQTLLPLASFEPIFHLRLRKNLAEAPAVAANTAPNAVAPNSTNPAGLPIVLVGTIGDSIALIQSGAEIQALAVGETSAGARILAIRPSQVDVEYAGQKLTLTKPKLEGGE